MPRSNGLLVCYCVTWAATAALRFSSTTFIRFFWALFECKSNTYRGQNRQITIFYNKIL